MSLPRIYVDVLALVPQNVTVFKDRAIPEAIQVQMKSVGRV